MKVYEATVIDKCAGAEPASYESYVAVGTGDDMERQKPATVSYTHFGQLRV